MALESKGDGQITRPSTSELPLQPAHPSLHAVERGDCPLELAHPAREGLLVSLELLLPALLAGSLGWSNSR